MSRVLLSQIRSLTLFKGELTKARRLPPIPQLKCVGKPCRLFQPDAVRCQNNGGSGADIDWTCEADLPEKLRFGRIDVSCEGWSHPGDPYVLKGSCGLEYRLVDISDSQNSNWLQNFTWSELFERIFVWIIILAAVYLLFGSYMWRLFNWLRGFFGSGPSRPSSSRPGRPSSFFPGGSRPSPDYPPPPPYSEHPKSSDSSWWSRSDPGASSGPGFWSGLGLGGLGGLAAARLFGRGNATDPRFTTAREYDWERERRGMGGGLFSSSWTFPGSSNTWRRNSGFRSSTDDDRSEGPSNLGRMRRSTGYGVTNVR